MPFGDASYFVALTDPKDQWHRKALKVADKELGRLHVTELVVSESITTVGAHCGAKPARHLYEFFLDSTHVEFANPEALEEAMEYHTKFDGTLSLSDCLTVVGMIKNKDHEVVSFDSDFDKVDGIRRIA
jgi:uncharacterized protein